MTPIARMTKDGFTVELAADGTWQGDATIAHDLNLDTPRWVEHCAGECLLSCIFRQAVWAWKPDSSDYWGPDEVSVRLDTRGDGGIG